VDLLDHLRQETGNQKTACREGALGAQRGNTQALLLARLHPSLNLPMYYVYILRCKDGSLYAGITTDVERRFKEHRAGTGGHYTRSHKPEKVLYREKAGTRSNALKREAEIKSWPREKKMQFVRVSLHALLSAKDVK